MTKSERKKQLREEIDEHLDALGAPPVHIQLASYSAGIDPCGVVSQLWELLEQCHRYRVDGRPRATDWERLWDHVTENPALRGGVVDRELRLSATKELMPYLHAKLKAVHVSGELSHLVSVEPLTDEDIDKLKERMKNEF